MKKYASASLTAIGAVLVLWGFAADTARAQDAGSLLRQQELREPRALPDAPPAAAHTAPGPAPSAAASVTVRLQSVRFEGAVDQMPLAELQGAVADGIGKEHDLAGLQALADRITQLLKHKGLFLARAVLPRQDITRGALVIRLLAGTLSRSEPVRIVAAPAGTLRIDTARLQAFADGHLQAGKAAREQDLEHAVMLMGDLPGLTAKARMEPGTEPESTQVLIEVEEGPLFSGSLSLDNFGSRSTGDVQLGGLLHINDPLRIGDQLSVGFVQAAGFANGRLSYSLPLGFNGTRLMATVSQLEYKHVEGLGLVAALRGTGSTTGLTLSHPLVRSRVRNLNLEWGVSRKATQDHALSGNLHDRAAAGSSVGLHADFFDGLGGGGLTLANLVASTGELDLSANPNDAADDARTYRTQGRFSKLNWGVTRLQKLDGTFTLYASASGQTAFNNLGSSEQFILGGPYGVRAYAGGEAAGDAGWLWSLELRYDLPASNSWGKWQIMGFYDEGHVTLHKDTRGLTAVTASGANAYQIAGWGLGLQLNKSASHALRLVWAQKIGSNPGASVGGMDADGRANSSRLWLNGTVYF